MSLYDESIELVEYQQMLADIDRSRDRLDRKVSSVDPLADRPDIVIDSEGDYWTLAPVCKNYGLPLPVFYRFQYIPSKGKAGKTNRPQSARKVKYPNGRIWDESPKTAKVKR